MARRIGYKMDLTMTQIDRVGLWRIFLEEFERQPRLKKSVELGLRERMLSRTALVLLDIRCADLRSEVH